MSFIAELKRRNVFRVGAAYAVGAWIVLQLLDVVGEILELPPWGGKLILVLVVLGFFLSLFFAWAFELTPEGLKRDHEVDRNESIAPSTGRKLDRAIIVMLALAVTYLLFDKFYASAPDRAPAATTLEQATESATTEPASANKEQAPAMEPETSRQSIAVLPFDNRSRLEDDAFFVDGVHDDLLTSLARIGSLKVISRTSVSKYANTEKTIPEIAAELGVATVMEGAVQRAGNMVRINVQLIDARTDEHLWAEIFDRELTTQNLFAIQSEISTAIADALEATLSPSEQQRLANIPTENLAAYNAFLRGRQYMARRSAESLRDAAREFDRAVDLDPGYALAWVGVAEVRQLLRQYSTDQLQPMMERREFATQQALALDDQLGEAYISLATLRDDQGRYDEAEAAFVRGLELSPNYAPGHQWYGVFLSNRIDRLGNAVDHMDTALALDPLSSIIQTNRYDALARMGAFEEAQAQLDRLARSDPDFAPLYLRRGGWPFEAHIRLDEAIPNLRRARQIDPGNPLNRWLEGLAWTALGESGIAEELVAQLEAMNPDNWATVHVSAMRNIRNRDYAAAKEAMLWAFDHKSSIFGLQWTAVDIAVLEKDYERARRRIAQINPAAFDPDEWGRLIARAPWQACTAGWVLLQSGDEALGRQLLEQAVEFMRETAPRHLRVPEILPLGRCLAALGDRTGALTHLEAQMKLDYSFWTWLEMRAPAFDFLRDEPRFLAVMEMREGQRSEQLARLQYMQAEGKL